ncbi:MAG: hypothetical protein COB09_17670 [Thalassobium sp.]|uniref:CopG family transcriptional regulator n=1 Tax=Thalassolituus pacificus TaxID=2975440 RepID=A0A9X2WHF8_9GAMM|nr:hypothetical protein [Thalassolituus pacificus]MCT7360115.1 hypothetical protein [Thalassolituus pacificus]PHS61478.1 MAG: hypothetical protein COB09_17670 [Thalassobium sp.]
MDKAKVDAVKGSRSKKAKAVKNDAQLLIRINGEEREQFLALCEELDTSAAREVRRFIRSFIRKNQQIDD